MAGVEGETVHNEGESITKELETDKRIFTRSNSRIIADDLQAKSVTGYSTQVGRLSPRIVHLQKKEMFDSLVELYSIIFGAKINQFRGIMDGKTIPAGITTEKYLARVYISHWFLDLYVSIREACTKFPIPYMLDFYDKDVRRGSTTYDNYLILLLNTIKPTYIVGLQRDALYIPVITTRPVWLSRTSNYFAIDNFTIEPITFGAILRRLSDQSRGWQLSSVMSDPLGRIGWLLDWHGDRAYAWFPQEGNYQQDDITTAYILGVACTPTLAVRDADNVQQFEWNEVDDHAFERATRKRPQSFYGGIEVRAFEKLDIDHTTTEEVEVEVPRPGKGKGPAATVSLPPPSVTAGAIVISERSSGAGRAPDPDDGEEPAAQEMMKERRTQEKKHKVHVFRILDYVYYAKVVRKTDINTRNACHKILIYRD